MKSVLLLIQFVVIGLQAQKLNYPLKIDKSYYTFFMDNKKCGFIDWKGKVVDSTEVGGCE